MEVADVMMIEEREVIFFTQGGDYVAPLLMEGDGVDGSGSSSGLPAVVGAYKVFTTCVQPPEIRKVAIS